VLRHAPAATADRRSFVGIIVCRRSSHHRMCPQRPAFVTAQSCCMLRSAMMSIPFFLIVAALAAAWFGHRQASLVFWAAGLLALLLLFRAHATDVLNLVL
jgi:hypothetical protein